MTPTVVDGEQVIREGAANMQRGWETVGGRLFLTNRKLLFQSHRLNIQQGPSEIPLHGIADVQTGWTKFLGLIPVTPNSIVVRQRNGPVVRFVVFSRGQWVEAIRRAIA